jgi:hypothetical protein
MSTWRLSRRNASGICVGSLAGAMVCMGALADQPAAGANELPNSLPQDGFFSSIKQSLKEGDQDVVRGHFDLGTPPNSHRYYCLVDPKSGAVEPNGVLGDTLARADGMTGIKSSAVSLYRCAKAEQQGILVTEGYVLTGRAALGVARAQQQAQRLSAQSPPPAPTQSPAAGPAPGPAPSPPPAPAPAAVAPSAPTLAAAPPATSSPAPAPDTIARVDVSGVKIGMSLVEARAVLKSKKLPQYKEWTETLSYIDGGNGAPQPVPDGRFVNVIATWSAPSAAGSGGLESAGEAVEVMFTPEPGKERVMAIVHSVGYPVSHAIHESALEDGLVKKYGGFSAAGDLPQSPTWRIQSAGNVAVGDACNRRGSFGGLGELDLAGAARENLALRKSLEEFRYQIDRCGSAIVTEDHAIANGGALPEDRLVTRYTVTAYSPVLAYEGARAAAQLIAAAGHESAKPAAKGKSEPAPDL